MHVCMHVCVYIYMTGYAGMYVLYVLTVKCVCDLYDYEFRCMYV